MFCPLCVLQRYPTVHRCVFKPHTSYDCTRQRPFRREKSYTLHSSYMWVVCLVCKVWYTCVGGGGYLVLTHKFGDPYLFASIYTCKSGDLYQINRAPSPNISNALQMDAVLSMIVTVLYNLKSIWLMFVAYFVMFLQLVRKHSSALTQP